MGLLQVGQGVLPKQIFGSFLVSLAWEGVPFLNQTCLGANAPLPGHPCVGGRAISKPNMSGGEMPPCQFAPV